MKATPSTFYKPSVTVDIVVFTLEDGFLKVLSIQRAAEPFKNASALPGGFLASGETTLQAGRRILEDKVGMKDVYLEQLYTFDDPKRDPRGPVLSVAYFALAPRNELSIDASANTQHPLFLKVGSLGKLAFDHNKIVRYAHDRLKGRLEYTNIAFSLLPDKFTFAELQNVYEIIFGKNFDKRNFRKKITRLELIKPTKETTRKGRQRPALLYRSTSKQSQKFKDVF